MREMLVELLVEAERKCGKINNCEDCVGHGKGVNCVLYNYADHLLANGVIVPPCKVGDTVYVICNNEVQETTVFSMIAQTEDDHYVFIIQAKAIDGAWRDADGYHSVFCKFIFCKTVFLTREEAEEALDRLKGGEGDG